MKGDDAYQKIEHLFRHESGRIISHLVKKFGSDNLDLIEDSVQHALLRSMQTWPFRGIPDNPAGWMLRVAANYLVDQFRKKKKVRSDPERQHFLVAENREALDDELKDDLLRMMFACCHTHLSIESQIILTLKILCGFNNREVARALLKSEEAVAKSYTRSKKRLKRELTNLEVPVGRDLSNRLNVILKVIYVLFNEGYNSISEDELIRRDLCLEALRLTNLLLDHPQLRKPGVHALKALLCFQSSRFEARIGKNGELLNLSDQNRNLWDRKMIEEGIKHLRLSYAFGNIGEYHVEASIAAYHATAENYEKTDWQSIYYAYLLLEKIKTGPMVILNRIIAESMHLGPEKALDSIGKSGIDEVIGDQYLYCAVMADLYRKTGEFGKAADFYRLAGQRTTNLSEKAYFEKKMAEILN